MNGPRAQHLSGLRCADADNSFGPVGLVCRFDFTLLFEESILFIGPSSLFLLLATLRIWQLRKERIKVRRTLLRILKVVATSTYSALQLALLVLWARSGVFRTKTSVPAAVFGVLDAIIIFGLSSLEHSRYIRPSTLLQVYLLVSLLFDAVRARSLWLIGGYGPIAIIFLAAVVVKLWMLLLECVEKRRLLNDEYKSLTVESTSGIFNISVFWWLNRLLVAGAKNVFSLGDLEEVKQSYRSDVLQKSLEEAWATAAQNRQNAFLFAVLHTFRWQIFAGVFPRLCMTAFNFSQPFLMNTLLNYLSDENAKGKNDGYGLIGAYALVFLGIAVSTGRHSLKMSQATVLLRGSLTSIIYSKTLGLDLRVVESSNANTLMSVDVERICMVSQEMHQSWASLIELGIAIFLLERQLGVACLMPVILALGCTLGTVLLSGRIGGAQGTWFAVTQKRLRGTESVLASIKSAKMMALITRASQLISDLRAREIQASLGFRKLLMASVVLSEVTNIMAPVLTFSLFTIIAKVKHQQSLLVAQAFTSLTVLSLIGTPIIMFVQIVPMLFATVASFQRIQDFLSSGTIRRSDHCVSSSNSATEEFVKATPSATKDVELKDLGGDASAFSVTDGAFGWSDGEPVLRDINLNVSRGSFVAVVGPVGSGKTTLLKALLGELPQIRGDIQKSSRLAFCDQNAWLTNTTLRANIVGPREFDGPWYETVLQACCIKDELKTFPGGDEFLLGSKGISLSGGQKTRIAIARALYARERVAIFDDVLAGLDAHTEEAVFQRVFGRSGILRRQGATIIMVTSRLRRLNVFDHIVALDKGGKIVEQGPLERLQSRVQYIQDASSQEHFIGPLQEAEVEEPEEASSAEKAPLAPAENHIDTDRQAGDLIIYKYFFRSTGWLNTAFALAMSCTNAFCVVYSTIWLQQWAQNNTGGSDRVLAKYPIVYALLGLLALTSLAIFCHHTLIVMIPKSGRALHNIVLTTLINAPLSFFTKTDTGVTMNRFSQDMQLVDAHIQNSLINTIEGFITVLFRIIVVCITAKYTSATLPFSILAIYLIQKYYLRTSRQLRLLDIEAKAPLYSHFLETLSGLATIRAYGWQHSFEARTHSLLDLGQRPFYLLACIQRWLTFVLDCLTGSLGLLVVILAVTLNGKGGMSPGQTGVALINIMSFNQALAMLIISWTQLETSIGGVSRIRDFERSTKSEVRKAVRPDPVASWPEKGSIEMKGVVAAYDSDSPSVLKNVSLSISAGERIGICGRTGSGKSSLILSILQMLELQSGSITIDGVDLSSISRETTRARLITVPQDFVLLDETIRLALDSSGLYADETIIQALRKVQIWHLLEEKNGLDTLGSKLTISHGERQLFVLARAMIAVGTVVILDEACSSVDAATNELMQRLIRSEFAGRTVLAVEHNMANLLDYDRVVVLDKGEIVEQGRPEELLERASTFRALYESTVQYSG